MHIAYQHQMLGLALIGLTGCSTTPVLPEAEPERISYAIGPCHGFCPAYSVSVASDGAIWFVGQEHTKRVGRVDLASSPETFRRVSAALSSIMPEERDFAISAVNCVTYATDHQTITVTWHGKEGVLRKLEYDLGCHDAQYKNVAEGLAQVKSLLPIDDLVGQPGRP